ncbi:hypothetical protein ACFWZK_35890 [[Kitasatospora] papulosa]|uniref:hypothetical protein n=1 Tax=[Kitasatospora] papulosa TaxID=1464011 RepID=UPI0036A5F746
MKHKKQLLNNKKSVLIFASSAILGIGTVALLGNSLSSTDETSTTDTQEQISEESNTTTKERESPNVKEGTKDKAASIFDRFELSPPLGGLFAGDQRRENGSAALQPQ